VPLPLYVAGLLRTLKPRSAAERDRLFTMLGPLVSTTAFWMFVYDWADKRFLLYIFPFLASFLAAGLSTVLAWARAGRLAFAACAGALVCAALWNGIRYPSYGLQYLALTPRDFLELTSTQNAEAKTSLHLSGARLVRLHEALPAALSRSLFDFRLKSPECPIDTPTYRCLATLKAAADRHLRPGEPIGLFTPRVWAVDFYVARNRLANVLLRPVVLPDLASVTFEGTEMPETEAAMARCGPYALVARR